MDFVNGPIPLGEWLPDIQDLKFPNLAEAANVEPVGTVYKSFDTLVTNAAGPVVPGGFLRGFGQAVYAGSVYTYAGTDDGIFESSGGAAFTARSSTLNPTQYDFLQFDDLQIVAPSALSPMYRTLGSTSNFVTLGSTTGSAPKAVRLGKINKFLIVGNTDTATYHMQWAGIDQPLSWPTPNTATATAQQSGEQYLDAEFGEITGFSSGDQFGLVFQTSAVTRITYVGPPVVFQFDKISDKIGCPYPRSIVQVGNRTYFISGEGFCVTDGVTVTNIGLDKCNDYFRRKSAGAKERVYGAHNRYKNLILWSYCNTSDSESLPSDVIILNHMENRFSKASLFHEGILSTNGIDSILTPNLRGFGSDNTLGSFQNTAGSSPAVLETGSIEFNPGGFTHLSGAKLIVDQTANGIVAYSKISNDLWSITTGSASTTNAATGFADFRREARYHSLKWEVSDVFDQAQAMEFKAFASGSR